MRVKFMDTKLEQNLTKRKSCVYFLACTMWVKTICLDRLRKLYKLLHTLLSFGYVLFLHFLLTACHFNLSLIFARFFGFRFCEQKPSCCFCAVIGVVLVNIAPAVVVFDDFRFISLNGTIIKMTSMFHTIAECAKTVNSWVLVSPVPIVCASLICWQVWTLIDCSWYRNFLYFLTGMIIWKFFVENFYM